MCAFWASLILWYNYTCGWVHGISMVICITSQKNYEGVISQYKKKLEDAGDLRKQVKATEEKNMMYVQQNLDLEEVSHVIS